jgi:hypothetical protein
MRFLHFSTKMASNIAMAIVTSRIKNGCVTKGEWFNYISEACTEEHFDNGGGDSYRVGDDDDGGYDYASGA